MMAIGDHEPDDLCPSCGVPQPLARRGLVCARCGYQFDAEGPEACRTGHLTPFGYGLCGLIAGGHLGAGIALADPDADLEDPRLVLFPLLLGVACCVIAWWVGKHLDWRVHRGYEAGLFGFMVAGFSVFVLGLFGVGSADTLAAVGMVAMVIATPLFRRGLYRGR